jgi:hypothetical protein
MPQKLRKTRRTRRTRRTRSRTRKVKRSRSHLKRVKKGGKKVSSRKTKRRHRKLQGGGAQAARRAEQHAVKLNATFTKIYTKEFDKQAPEGEKHQAGCDALNDFKLILSEGSEGDDFDAQQKALDALNTFRAKKKCP